MEGSYFPVLWHGLYYNSNLGQDLSYWLYHLFMCKSLLTLGSACIYGLQRLIYLPYLEKMLSVGSVIELLYAFFGGEMLVEWLPRSDIRHVPLFSFLQFGLG